VYNVIVMENAKIRATIFLSAPFNSRVLLVALSPKQLAKCSMGFMPWANPLCRAKAVVIPAISARSSTVRSLSTPARLPGCVFSIDEFVVDGDATVTKKNKEVYKHCSVICTTCSNHLVKNQDV